MPAGNLLHWAIVALVAAVVCFGGIAGAAVDIARILFWVFLVIFLVVLVMNFMGRVRPAAAALGLSALLLAAGPAPAQPRRDTIFRDPSGRMTGRAEQRGDGTIFRDPSGRMTGRAARRGDETIFRDPSGRIIGRAEAR